MAASALSLRGMCGFYRKGRYCWLEGTWIRTRHDAQEYVDGGVCGRACQSSINSELQALSRHPSSPSQSLLASGPGMAFFIQVDVTRVAPVFVQFKLHQKASSFLRRNRMTLSARFQHLKSRDTPRTFASTTQRTSTPA